MAEKKNNLELWNKVEKTDPKYTKTVNQRGGFTSINASYQIMTATEQWGSYGATWGIKEIDYEYITFENKDVLAVAKVVFFYPEGSFPISSGIMVSKGGRVDDEFAKKLETDITTKALSKLGFSADVFLGRYDDNRYLAEIKKEFAPKPEKVALVDLNLTQYEAVIKAIEEAGLPQLTGIEAKMDKYDPKGANLKKVRKMIENKFTAMEKSAKK